MIINQEDIVLNKGWVLLEPFEPTVEGFVSSASSEDKPNFGKVVNLDCETNVTCTEGDILLFGMQSTATQSINGKIFYLLREEDIIGVVSEEKNTA